MHTNWHPVGCFFWPRENGQEFSLMSGERSFLNLFRNSRTPLDSIRDKLLTLIYFVIVQCPSVRTTWYSVSCARKGYTWAARDLRMMKGHAVTLQILLLRGISWWWRVEKTFSVLFSGKMAQLMNFMGLLIFPFKWGGHSFPSSAVWKSWSYYTRELESKQARNMWLKNLLSCYSCLIGNCAIMIINNQITD